jgi:signal peptidase I
MKNFAYLILIGITLGFLIKLFILEIFTVPTASMEPTILRGSKVWLQKVVFNFHRNDVVGFVRNEEYFVKRIVGMPSDLVYAEGGIFYLSKLDDASSFVEDMPFYKIPQKGDTLVLNEKNIDFYKPLIEKNEGVQAGNLFNKIFINNSESNTYIFKHNYYFVQGDNTAGSQDSRHFGLIGENQLKGKVFPNF